MVCEECGKPCRNKTQQDLHSKHTGHAKYVDKVNRISEALSRLWRPDQVPELRAAICNRTGGLKCMCLVQTNEAAAPMDTEAEMKQVRAEQDDTPAKSSAAEDAPLVSAWIHITSLLYTLFSAIFCAASLLSCKIELRMQRDWCWVQVEPKVNEDLLQQLQEMGFSRNK